MSSCLIVARTGRHKQRYQDHLRLVAGCIPYKKVEESLLVLMISTPKRNDLVFPKGGWEDDESLSEAACREAIEEAGVLGLISENPLGAWEFRSKSSENSSSSQLVGGCKGYMFALQVTQELDHWPGHSNYQRKWVGIEEAFELCRYEWMRDALQKFIISVSVHSIHSERKCSFDHHLSSSSLMSSNSINYLGNTSSSCCCPSPPPPQFLQLN